MHNCEEFRERITEHIIDRENVAGMAEFHRELSTCASCSEFCAESQELMEALSEIDLSISESQWNGIQQRLNARILASDAAAGVPITATVAAPRAKARDYISTALARFGRVLQYSFDDHVGIDAFGFALEIQQHAMAQRPISNRANVID